MDNSLSVGVRRLACLSASGSSFAVAARHLFEYCGLEISAETVRRHCEKEARAMGLWLDTQEVVAEAFAKAEGEAEFQTDAGKVNTTTGWRDLKVASFARRPLGASARLEDWKTRQLPQTRDAFHAAETIGTYTCRQYGESTETKKARYERGVALLLKDGAAGMRQFETEERQLLDATRNPSGNDLSATTTMVALLMSCALTVPVVLAEGAPAEVDAPAPTTPTPHVPSASKDENANSGLLDEDDSELAERESALNSKTPERRIAGLSRYFAKHANRLNYADRLREGRPIGSGMIEGNIKTITLRLKARGARWLKANVTAMSRLCCLSHGTFWTDYWKCSA